MTLTLWTICVATFAVGFALSWRRQRARLRDAYRAEFQRQFDAKLAARLEEMKGGS